MASSEGMSVQELKEQIEQLTPAEQGELASFLKAKRLVDEPRFRARVEEAHERMDKGAAVSSSELRELLKSRERNAG